MVFPEKRTFPKLSRVIEQCYVTFVQPRQEKSIEILGVAVNRCKLEQCRRPVTNQIISIGNFGENIQRMCKLGNMW